MFKCKKCESKNNLKNNFCSNCGEPLIKANRIELILKVLIFLSISSEVGALFMLILFCIGLNQEIGIVSYFAYAAPMLIAELVLQCVAASINIENYKMDSIEKIKKLKISSIIGCITSAIITPFALLEVLKFILLKKYLKLLKYNN